MTLRQYGDTSAEKDFLSVLLNHEHRIHEAAQAIAPSQLTGEKARIIYDAILSLANRFMVVDVATVCDEMGPEALKKVGGRSEVYAVYARSVNEAFFANLCSRIKVHAALRDMAAVAAEVLSEAQNLRPDEQLVYNAIDMFQSRLSDIVAAGATDDVGFSNPEAMHAADRLVQPVETKGSGISTGFLDLDDVLRGFRPGQLILLAARSRVGKTSFACDIIRRVAKQGSTVVFFSLEMTRSEIWERMVCGESGANLHELKSRQATDEERIEMQDAGRELASRKIIIKDNPDVTPLSMRGFSRKVQHKDGLGLIVVDYLQCIKSGKDKHNRYESVSEVSRQLKVMARVLNVPILALAQLNRMAEQEEPMLSHLRESGSLEQDADVVMLLNRPHLFDDSKDPDLATLHIAKHRNGPCQKINLTFDRDSVSFKDWAPPVQQFVVPTNEPTTKARPVSRRVQQNNWTQEAYD